MKINPTLILWGNSKGRQFPVGRTKRRRRTEPQQHPNITLYGGGKQEEEEENTASSSVPTSPYMEVTSWSGRRRAARTPARAANKKRLRNLFLQ